MTLYYSPDFYFETGDAVYIDTSLALTLPYGIGLGLHIGYRDVDEVDIADLDLDGDANESYIDWRIGLSKEILGLTLDLSYWDAGDDPLRGPRIAELRPASSARSPSDSEDTRTRPKTLATECHDAVSSRIAWLITVVLTLTGALAHAKTCDVDADGDIDRRDFRAILADIGERASGPNDPRDADGNGRILSNDAQLCARRCTLALCAIPPNKAPIAKNDAATTAVDTPVRINVIANDRDRDGRIVPRTARVVTNPKHGKVTRHRDGTVTYSPALGFRGRDRFGYRVRDNDGATSNAARVRMTVESGNGLPMADAGPDFNVATGALVTLDGSNSSDPDGDPLTFSWQFLSVPQA